MYSIKSKTPMVKNAVYIFQGKLIKVISAYYSAASNLYHAKVCLIK